MIIKDNLYIEQILKNRFNELASNFDSCRNHAYRVYNHCLNIDQSLNNKTTYAIASTFKVIGIWQNTPTQENIKQARYFLEKEELFEIIINVISILDEDKSTLLTSNVLKQAFRIDLKIGKKNILPKDYQKELLKEIPYHGYFKLILKSLYKRKIHNI